MKAANLLVSLLSFGVVPACAEVLENFRHRPSNPHCYFYLGQAKLYQQKWQVAFQYFFTLSSKLASNRIGQVVCV